MHINSIDPIVRQCLQSIIETVQANGGSIHPALCINHDAEQLWITCPAEFIGETLLQIPDNLFILVSPLTWSDDNGILRYSGDTSALSPAQQSILDAMLGLYNATDKIEKIAKRFPDNLFRQDTELWQQIKVARPTLELSDKNLAEQFISTRLSSQNNEDSEESIDYLMPLIDMLDHHPYAPKYGRNEANDWIIPVQHPVPGSEQCFVRYQKGDSFANALWHGYYESAARYLSSVQCSFRHESLGQIIVHGVNYERRKLNAPFVQRTETSLDLHSIILDPNTLGPLRTFLGLAARSKDRNLNQAQAEIIADTMIQHIIKANQNYFENLREFCSNAPDEQPLRALFYAVAKHQLDVLQEIESQLTQ